MADISPNDVVLALATPHQRELAWRLNGQSWAAPMPLADYMDREKRLSETPLSRDGGCSYYVLHRRGDPDDIISGCEALAKRVIIADGQGGGVREERAYAIASVYTNPAYRGKGMASLMLRGVQERMDGDSACSVLYSDIGRVFYAKLGWAPYPSFQVALSIDAANSAGGKVGTPPGVRFFGEDETRKLCDAHVSSLKNKFSKLDAKDGKTHVAFLPTYEQIQWHFTRDGFMAGALHGKPVVNRGAVTEDGKAWVYFDHDFREAKLKLHCLVGEDAGALAGLLRAALAEAAAWGLKKVLAWNPDENVAAAAGAVGGGEGGVEVVFDERHDGSIPCLRWKGDEEVETVWEENYYYAWC